MARLDQSVALGVGAAGALVDVSEYANLGEGVEYTYGRTSEFDDVEAGVWSFTLDNLDGRFTPDNASSPLVTPLSEGAAVCWQLGDRLVSGKVVGVEPVFPGGESAWGQVVVTCDDMLGEAGRTEIASITESLIRAAGAQAYWPLESDFSDATDNGIRELGNVINPLGLVSFDSELVPNGTTQLSTTSLLGEDRVASGLNTGLTTGWLSFWFTPTTGLGSIVLRFGLLSRYFTVTDSVLSITGTGTTTIGRIEPFTPMHYSVELSTGAFYLNGELVATAGSGFDGQFVAFQANGTSAETGFWLGQVAFTDSRVDAWAAGAATLGGRAELIGSSVDGLTLDVSDDLWGAPVGVSDLIGMSALDALNDVLRTEQGHMYTTTTGTLLSPTQNVIIRERDRPTTLAATFSVEDDLDGAPELIRDLTNLVSTVRVDGTNETVTVTDTTLTTRVGSKNTTETTILANREDLSLWGQDRLIRGANIRLRVSAATIDAMDTATDRETDLLALKPGDRIRFTDLPTTQLGFSEWDGWLLGAEETHTVEEHLFVFTLQPVLPPVAVFNAARFAAGTSLTLSSNINAAVTSMSIATTDTTFTTDTADLPATVIMDDEEMTVTAVTSATPQVFTITRGVNGTTAAAHTAGAQLELADVQPDDDTTFITNYCTNPQFEIDSTGMATRTASGGVFAYSRVASSGYNTAYAGRATITTATTSASIIYINPLITELTAGDTFWYAVYARPSATTTLRNRFYMFEAADGSGAVSFSDGADVALSSGVYTLVDAVSGTVDASRLSVRPSIRFANAVPLSTTIDFKIVCVTDIDPTTPFSGDTAPTDVRLPSWAGTRYLTHSYLALDGQVQPALFGF